MTGLSKNGRGMLGVAVVTGRVHSDSNAVSYYFPLGNSFFLFYEMCAGQCDSHDSVTAVFWF